MVHEEYIGAGLDPRTGLQWESPVPRRPALCRTRGEAAAPSNRLYCGGETEGFARAQEKLQPPAATGPCLRYFRNSGPLGTVVSGTRPPPALCTPPLRSLRSAWGQVQALRDAPRGGGGDTSQPLFCTGRARVSKTTPEHGRLKPTGSPRLRGSIFYVLTGEVDFSAHCPGPKAQPYHQGTGREEGMEVSRLRVPREPSRTVHPACRGGLRSEEGPQRKFPKR